MDEQQQLRKYQASALESIRDHYKNGKKRVLLHLATGGGKTLIFCKILKGVYEKKSNAIMVVKGKDLVDQASQRLFREGVDHGCLQGNHWNYKPECAIQVCSIDTLYRRRNKQDLPKASLIVIDEAHYATSDSFRWLIEKYPDAFFLPVTATPHVKRGLRHVADDVVYPITLANLIEQGYLVPPVYYAPSKPDLRSVPIEHSTGDYRHAELSQVVNTATLYGDIVSHWLKLASNRPTVCFAVDLVHADNIKKSFLAAGVKAEMVEADTPKSIREAVQERLKSKETKIVVNVGILCVGVDMPYVSCIIMARPTKSYNLFIQQAGRGTRTYDGKSDFIILDHANNIMEHGFIEDERLCDLDGAVPNGIERPCTCDACFAVFSPLEEGRAHPEDANKSGRSYICPMCGHNNSPVREDIDTTRKKDLDESIELARVTADIIEIQRKQLFVENLCDVAVHKEFKPRWVWFKIKDKYDEPTANKFWALIQIRVPAQIRESRPSRNPNITYPVKNQPV